MATHTRKKLRKPPVGPKQCHPRLRNKHGNCLATSTLNQVADALGAPKNLRGRGLKHWMTRRTRCKSERCWVEKAPMEGGKKEEIIRSYFRPTKPEGWKNDPDEWLDSQNIADVMKQYEEAYPKFKFMGTFPIDFAAPDPYQKDPKKCLQNEICSLNLKEMAKSGKTKLGFVYNLDPHNKGGSHWVASFTDIPGRRSYYFDSYGFETPAQIARFMRSLTLQDPKMRLAYNANRFQYGDTECGMYCMIFIICMLEGMSFKHFCKSKFRDMEIFELRNWLFAPKDE